MKLPIISTIVVAACVIAASATLYKSCSVESALKEQVATMQTELQARGNKINALEADVQQMKGQKAPAAASGDASMQALEAEVRQMRESYEGAITAAAKGEVIHISGSGLKIASVNVQELYTMFHKRFNVETLLKEQEAVIKSEIKTREEKLRTLQEEQKKIHDSYDPSLSEAATKKLRDENAAKLNEIQAAAQELQTFAQRRSLAFREMHRREMIALLQEVQGVISDVTSKGGYDLVIDSGATTPQLATRVFPYVKSTYDITPEVLKQLNAGAPEGFDPKAELERLYGQPQQPAPQPVAPQEQAQ